VIQAVFYLNNQPVNIIGLNLTSVVSILTLTMHLFMIDVFEL